MPETENTDQLTDVLGCHRKASGLKNLTPTFNAKQLMQINSYTVSRLILNMQNVYLFPP